MLHKKKLQESFGFAFQGVWHAYKHNQNLKIHFIATVIVLVVSVMLGISGMEMGILGITILLVIASEMINTSIEEMVDLITTEHRREAKVAKDVAAGMVLVSSLGSVIIGILIFTPHILRLFH